MPQLRNVAAVAIVSLLAGCGWITIRQPMDKSSYTGAKSPVSVPVQIEVTKSVYDRYFDITDGSPGAPPMILSNFTVTTVPGYQNIEILSTKVALPPGSYTLHGQGMYDSWPQTT